MQDFLQINTELYDWQAIAISKIKKEIFGDRRTSFDVSSYNKKDTKLVVVYGPPQIGKTTLILYLLGIDSKFEYKNSKKTVYKLLKGSSKDGDPSTSTAILYEQSIDENFYIDETVAETAEKVIELIDNIRKAVEENSFKKDIIHIAIPQNAFYSELRESVSNIRYLDMPGIDSKNKLEIAHVDAIYKQFLNLATTILIVCKAEKIEDLSTLAENSRNKLSSHWELLNRYIIITAYSFTLSSVFEEYFKKPHEKGQFFNFIHNHYNYLIHKKDTLPNCKSNIYSFDLGTSLEKWKDRLCLDDYSELLETNIKMASELRDELQKRKGNILSGIVKELKILVEDDLQKELNYVTSQIERYEKLIKREKFQKEIRDNNRENKMTPQIEEIKYKKELLEKVKNNIDDNIKEVRELFFTYSLENLNENVKKYKKHLKEYFSHPILHSEKKMIREIENTFYSIENYIKNRLCINNNEKINDKNIVLSDEQKQKFENIEFPQIDTANFSKKTRDSYLEKKFAKQVEYYENEYLKLIMKSFQEYLVSEIEDLELQKEMLENDNSKLKDFSLNQQKNIDEYKDKLKSLKRSEKELVIKRNEILSYLDNYKKIGTETFKSCKKQLINDINICEEKNKKFLLLLYLGLKEDEYQKFLKEC